MNKLRFGVWEDKLMAEQTKVAIRCIQKRCQGVRCSLVKLHSKDIAGIVKAFKRGAVDAIALSYNEAENYLEEYKDDFILVARIRNVDDRYVLMTMKKSGKHFSNALVSLSPGCIGNQLQGLFDGVTCVETDERLEERVEGLLSGKCDGVLAPASDVINSGLSKIRRIRYKYFDTDILVQESGVGVIAILCRKDLLIADNLKDADNKRVSKQMAVEKSVLQYIAENNLSKDCMFSVRASVEKEQLSVNLYMYRDGEGRCFQRNGKYLERKQIVEAVCKDVQSHMLKSDVF